MITCRQTTWKKRIGEYEAVVSQVDVEDNRSYDPSKPNSTQQTMTIVFECVDPESPEPFEMKQKFVSPLTGGKGLFQQLLDAKGFLPDLESFDFDEQDLVGLEVVITIGERADRNDATKFWPDISKAVARTKKEKTIPGIGKAPKKIIKKESDGDENLPFGNDKKTTGRGW